MPTREEQEYKSIEEFQKSDFSKLKEDSPELRFLAEKFRSSWEWHKKYKLPEIQYNIKQYRNKNTEDFWDQSDNTEDNSRQLFSAGMVKKYTNNFVSIITKENPRPEINPIMLPRSPEKFAMYFRFLDPLLQQGAVDHGAVNVDEQGNISPGTNAGVREFQNEILDTNDRKWWREYMPLHAELTVRSAILCGEGHLQLVSRETPDGEKIFPENMPSTNVLLDPESTTYYSRDVIFHINPMSPAVIASQYDIDIDEIECTEEYSGEEIRKEASRLDENQLTEYKAPKAILVQAFFNDKRKVKIKNDYGESGYEFAYPYGRYITFLWNQKTATGINVLEDYPNPHKHCRYTCCILNPEDEIHGQPVINDIINLSNIANMVMQQSVNNIEAHGSVRMLVDKEDVDTIDDYENSPCTVMPVNDVNNTKIELPQNIAENGINMMGFLEGLARDITGIREVSEGKDPGDIISGKALQFMKSQVQQNMQRYIGHYASWLTQVARARFDLMLDQIVAGSVIEYRGEKVVIPFALKDFIESIEVFITPDSVMPKDELSQKNLLIALADIQDSRGMFVIPPEFLLKKLEIEDYQEATNMAEKRFNADQMIQQLQQKLEQTTQQLQQIGGEYEKLQKQSQQADSKMQIEMLRQRANLMEQQIKDQGMDRREMMRGQLAIEKQEAANQGAIAATSIKAGSEIHKTSIMSRIKEKVSGVINKKDNGGSENE